MSFNGAVMVFVKENYNRIHFWHMSKDEAINILKDITCAKKFHLRLTLYLESKNLSTTLNIICIT